MGMQNFAIHRLVGHMAEGVDAHTYLEVRYDDLY